jgi:hypothetical protein
MLPAAYDPRAKDEDLLDFLTRAAFNLPDQPSSLEDPDTTPLVSLSSSPSHKESVSIGAGCGDSLGRLRSAKEHQIETLEKVIGLKRSSHRCGNLKRGLP